jgi:hypothetical protein
MTITPELAKSNNSQMECQMMVETHEISTMSS